MNTGYTKEVVDRKMRQ